MGGKMEIIGKEHRLCESCMETHDVLRVKEMRHTTIKGVPVDYEAEYYYCDKADDFTVRLLIAYIKSLISKHTI